MHCSFVYFLKNSQNACCCVLRNRNEKKKWDLCVNTIVSIFVCLISIEAFAFRQYFPVEKFFAIIIFTFSFEQDFNKVFYSYERNNTKRWKSTEQKKEDDDGRCVCVSSNKKMRFFMRFRAIVLWLKSFLFEVSLKFKTSFSLFERLYFMP